MDEVLFDFLDWTGALVVGIERGGGSGRTFAAVCAVWEVGGADDEAFVGLLGLGQALRI